MDTETNVLEYEPIKTDTDLETQEIKKERKTKPEKNGEINLGMRALMMIPLSGCEKLDRIFGSGGEAIVHHMWFESGQSLFDNMLKCDPRKSLEELLSVLIKVQPSTGWGNISVKIVRAEPPMVDIVVKNSPVKTTKGSQKYLIGSFWAGVLSRYFNRQLICKNFGYDAEKDEFTCSVTI